MIPVSLYDVPMILQAYADGIYTADDLAVFVVVSVVTPEQFQQATGKPYTA